MVDWDRVERLRSRGWDWDRIAGDEKVDFTAEEGAGEPGRALRAIYYQRRSRQQRRSTSGGKSGDKSSREDLDRPRWTLARIGYIVTPLFAIWFLLAYLYPSPVGVYVSAIPFLGIFLFGAAALLAVSLFRSTERWSTVYRNSVVVGAVLGLVVAGGFGLFAISQGCPSLTAQTYAEPSSWSKAPNSAWTENGVPVFYFYGAIACPYCSASSWSILYALQKFGSVSGLQFGHSSPNDAFPNTPEVFIDTLSVQSSHVALIADERHDPTLPQGPTPSGCIEQAYVSAYGQPGIPFIVINGQFFHAGSLIPTQPTDNMSQLQGLSPQQVLGQINNQSGPAWDAISPPAYLLMAFILKTDGNQPASVAQLAPVAADLAAIT